MRVAHDGQQGLSIIREFRPDVVVLDVMMPHVDGFGVIERLHSDGLFSPVLLLTAKDAVEDRVAGLAIGFVMIPIAGYVVGPLLKAFKK